MRHPSFKDLLDIVDDGDILSRNRKLETWWKTWVVEKTTTQLVANRSVLNANQHNLVCETVAGAIAVELMYDNAVSFDMTNTRYDATIFALRNKPRPQTKLTRVL